MTSAKQWFSAQELAEMKLAGLPASDSAILRNVKKNSWACREKARGKGMEYQPPKAIMQQIALLSASNKNNSLNKISTTNRKTLLQRMELAAKAFIKAWKAN